MKTVVFSICLTPETLSTSEIFTHTKRHTNSVTLELQNSKGKCRIELEGWSYSSLGLHALLWEDSEEHLRSSYGGIQREKKDQSKHLKSQLKALFLILELEEGIEGSDCCWFWLLMRMRGRENNYVDKISTWACILESETWGRLWHDLCLGNLNELMFDLVQVSMIIYICHALVLILQLWTLWRCFCMIWLVDSVNLVVCDLLLILKMVWWLVWLVLVWTLAELVWIGVNVPICKLYCL